MIRLLLRIFGIKDFEVCASCETLKQQLEFERAEKKELTETLLGIIRPKDIVMPSPVELQPLANATTLFSRRRAALEARERHEAEIKRNSPVIGKPDKEIEKLEEELGVSEEQHG